jgi:hypothetical protein
MAESMDGGSDRALYLQWRRLRPAEAVPPDALQLAAYAERRLGADEAAQVELAIAGDPSLIEAVFAARLPDPPTDVSEALLRRAEALVLAGPGAEIIPLRPRPRAPAPAWRQALGWGMLAASVIAVSFMGFGLGVEAQQALDEPASAAPVDLFDAADASGG